MVDTMEVRAHEEAPERSIRPSQIRMLRPGHPRPDQIHPQPSSEKRAEAKNLKRNEHQNSEDGFIDEMHSKGRHHRHLGLRMMDAMEGPEPRDHVAQTVVPIVEEVENEDQRHDLHRWREI